MVERMWMRSERRRKRAAPLLRASAQNLWLIIGEAGASYQMVAKHLPRVAHGVPLAHRQRHELGGGGAPAEDTHLPLLHAAVTTAAVGGGRRHEAEGRGGREAG